MSLKKWQKIFVNRSLNMASIKAIGFDMDHTLAVYNHVTFETLAFKVTLDKFIAAGYPKELAKLTFDPNSVIRGLLVDQERGNLLKVDAHKYVKTAFHGKRRLDKEERHRLYNSQSFKAEKLTSVDTFFALSETQLFIEIVDFIDRNPGKINKSYKDVFKDLRKFIDKSHADGSIKQVVMANPEHYFTRDKHLQHALMRLIEGGKSLFLLTNSNFEYTNVVMSYLLNNDDNQEYPHWQDYFDVTIVSASKPAFFTGEEPFKRLDINTGDLKPLKGGFQKGLAYVHGNVRKLEELLGIKGDEVLYVGDHIYGDIIRSKGLVNWRTMLIVEELDLELLKIEETRKEWEDVRETLRERERFDEEVQKLRSKLSSIERHVHLAELKNDRKKAMHLQRELEKTQAKLADQEPILRELDKTIKDLLQKRQSKIHPVWGEVMKVGLEKSRFANQVEQYACLYSSRVTNFRFYSPVKRFVSYHDLLPHDLP